VSRNEIACSPFCFRIISEKELRPMRSRFAVSALVVASLFGASAVASAQKSQPAPGESSQGNVGPGATKDTMGKMKPGTTTGMNRRESKKSDRRNPSSQGNVGPGTNQAGSIGK
jgi:hypothetical protein